MLCGEASCSTLLSELLDAPELSTYLALLHILLVKGGDCNAVLRFLLGGTHEARVYCTRGRASIECRDDLCRVMLVVNGRQVYAGVVTRPELPVHTDPGRLVELRFRGRYPSLSFTVTESSDSFGFGYTLVSSSEARYVVATLTPRWLSVKIAHSMLECPVASAEGKVTEMVLADLTVLEPGECSTRHVVCILP